MYAQKISISLSKHLYDFTGVYMNEYKCKSRSEVINHALKMLQRIYLEQCYKAADKEMISDEFETTTFDGLEDETW